MDPRFIVAACLVRRGRDAHTTTVAISAPPNMPDFDVNLLVRQRAAEQLNEMKNVLEQSFDPRSVIVLNIDDTTYGLDPGE